MYTYLRVLLTISKKYRLHLHKKNIIHSLFSHTKSFSVNSFHSTCNRGLQLKVENVQNIKSKRNENILNSVT